MLDPQVPWLFGKLVSGNICARRSRVRESRERPRWRIIPNQRPGIMDSMDERRPMWRTRLVEGELPRWEFDIEFWHE